MNAPTIANKYNNHGINVSSLTIPSVVVASGQDLYVGVLGCDTGTPGNGLPSGITFNGVAMSFVRSDITADDNATLSWWRLIQPTPATASVVVTYPGNNNHGSSATAYVVAGGRGDHLINNGNHNDATASSPQTNSIVTTRDKSLVLDMFVASSSGETVTVNSPGSQDFNTQDTGGSPVSFANSVKTTKGTQTLSETPSNTGRGYAWSAIAIPPPAVGIIRTNLVVNPRFQSGSGGWNLDSDYSVTAGSGGGVSGGLVHQVSTTGFANFTTDNGGPGIPVLASTNYQLSFYVKMNSFSGNHPRIQINGGSAYGTTLVDQEVPDTGGVWARVTINVNTGSQTALYFRIYNNNGTCDVDYSNFMAELLSNAGGYFDGAFVSTSLDIYEWTGTADNSSSTDEENYILSTKTFTADGIVKVLAGTYTFTVDAIINDPSLNLGTDLIREDMTSTPIGTIGGNAAYVAPLYTRLTPAANSNTGYIDYLRSIPTALIFEADFYANGGADANYIYWGCSSIPSGEDSDFGGYIVALDEYSGDDFPVQLQWRGTRLASSAFPHNFGDGVKRTLKMVQDGTRIIVYVNNVKLIDFTDVTRVFGGTHIGVGARTGGVNAEHRVYRIHAYPFTSPWHPTINTAGLSTLPYRSVDVMKLTKDTVNSQQTASQIIAVVKGITDTFTNLTHIAIAVPLNIDADYAAVGIVPSPTTEKNFTQLWCDAIHNAGLNVIFRGDFNELERSSSGPTGNWNSILKVGVNRLPRGTTSSAPTDGQSTWLGRLYALITSNPTWFKNGDVWAPMPERTENNTEVVPISSLTRVGTVATVTTPFNHNVGDQQPVTIENADQAAYNGSFIATKIDDTHFSYTVAGSPATPATSAGSNLQLQFGVSVFDDGNSLIDNTGSGVNANYAAFFEDVQTVANSAFTSINKTMHTGFSSNNYSEVNSGWIPQGLFDTLGRVVIDHYGVDHSPGEMYNNLVNLFNAKGHILDHQEWSDYWDGGLDTQTRTDYLTDFYNMLCQVFQEGMYEMLNYWGGWVGGTGEGILIDNSTPGTPSFSINTFGQILAQYFNPIPPPVQTGPRGTVYGFFLNGIKLKNPIEFDRDYVYRRTDTLVMSGGSVRDFTGLKKQYTLKFKNLNAQQVSDITTIMNLHVPVTFVVNGNDLLNINTTVWPYVGQVIYETLGSDYLATVTINLVEVDVPGVQ